ncbi:MAG TPA: hypothetical protein VFS95_10370, partial [Telluria sp.]|nr:hypothetical protein [Telluria sp.]
MDEFVRLVQHQWPEMRVVKDGGKCAVKNERCSGSKAQQLNGKNVPAATFPDATMRAVRRRGSRLAAD